MTNLGEVNSSESKSKSKDKDNGKDKDKDKDKDNDNGKPTLHDETVKDGPPGFWAIGTYVVVRGWRWRRRRVVMESRRIAVMMPWDQRQ
jgi:hypothetical protein